MTIAGCKLQPDAAPEPPAHDVTPPPSSSHPFFRPIIHRAGSFPVGSRGDCAVALKSVCAWCQLVMAAGAEPASHGICEACAAGLRARREAAARFVALLLAVLFFLASPAHAEPGTPEPTLRLVAIYGGAKLLDLGSTEYALGRGGVHEGNMLMRSRAVRWTAGAAEVALETWATRELQRHDHPKAARFLKWGVVGLRVMVAVHNIRLARGGR